MSKSKIQGEIIKQLLRKFPKAGSHTIAKMAYEKNPEMFTNMEAARTRARYYRGQQGVVSRKNVKDKELLKDRGSCDPFNFIPEAHNDNPKIWKLPKNFKKVLLINDLHIPYHEPEVIKMCLKYAKEQKIDCVYINGDLVDFFNLSFHEKDARKRPGIGEELQMCRQFLKGLKSYIDVPIYIKPANHEFRLERYLTVKAPELLDVDEFILDVLLRLGEMGINWIGRRDKCYFGKLLVEHGDRIKGTGGVNPARTLFLRYKRHAICGHFHRRSESASKIYDGHSILTFSVGSLCNLEPEYFEVNEHTNGFAIVEMNGDEFKVRNYTIENGKVY